MNKAKADLAFLILQYALYDAVGIDPLLINVKDDVIREENGKIYCDVYTYDYFEDTERLFTFECDRDNLGESIIVNLEKEIEDFDAYEFAESIICVPDNCCAKKDCTLYQLEYERIVEGNIMDDFQEALEKDIKKMRVIFDHVKNNPKAAQHLAYIILVDKFAECSELEAYKKRRNNKMTTPPVKDMAEELIRSEEYIDALAPYLRHIKYIDIEKLREDAVTLLRDETYLKDCNCTKPIYPSSRSYINIEGDVYCLDCKRLHTEEHKISYLSGLDPQHIINYFELCDAIGYK